MICKRNVEHSESD